MNRVLALLAASGLALAAFGSYGQTPGQRLELDRKGETIVLEPYAPNIVRVTLSLQHDPAVAKPGYGLVAAPDANVGDATFGEISSQANQPRQVQIGLKLYF